jgi:hypothetical protein
MEPAASMGRGWSQSDSLAVALACLAGVMALALLFWKPTPGWAAGTLILMALLVAYPVYHFVPHWKARIPVLLIIWALIGLFGWKNWPRLEQNVGKNPPPPVGVTPQNPAAPQVPGPNPTPPAKLVPHVPIGSGTPSGHQVVPKQQECQTGSICNQDSPNQGTQTVNNGPPPAHITVEQEAFSFSDGKLTTKVTLSVDHTLESPEFTVTCDRPCYLYRTGSGDYGETDLIRSPNTAPDKFTPIFAAPKPMGPGYLWLFVASNDGSSPRITSIEAVK